MSFSPEDLAAKVRQQARQHNDELTAARAEAAPVVTADPDELVTIEMTIDLEVTRITLKPRATRDLDALESLLVATLTDAIKNARLADPALRNPDLLGQGANDTMEDQLDQLQSEAGRVMQSAELRLTALRERLSAHRDAAAQRRR